ASVVVRRPAPNRVIEPGPAVVGVIHPAAGAVGRPADRDGSRDPYRAVARNDAPISIVIEIVDAIHTGRDVARGDGVELGVGARVVPAVPAVELRRGVGLDLRR